MAAIASSTPRRFARTRRGAVIASGTLAVLIGVLWVVSQFRGWSLAHVRNSLDRVGAIPEGTFGAWEYEESALGLWVNHHELSFFRLRTTARHKHAEDRDLLADRVGWFFVGGRPPTKYRQSEIWSGWRFLGMGGGEFVAGTGSMREISVPYWLLVVVVATPIYFAVGQRMRRRKRKKRGLCPQCGYQLDASMTTCPECGTARPPSGPVSASPASP